jgi:predicted Zn-ribbon and HTH transcriptional regulator
MAKVKTKTTSRIKGDCLIPTRPPPGALRSTLIETSPYEEREVIDYFEWQSSKDPKGPAKVEHLELVKSEAVWGRVHKVWDVHSTDGRWWVITEPTNLYSQELFPSLDYTLSFHIGLMARVAARESRQARGKNSELFAAAFRRWEQAAEAIDLAKEAEDFQAVGMKCRECLLTFARVAQKDISRPEGSSSPPKRGDFVHWAELIAEHAAAGAHAKDLRKYLKDGANKTWQLVNWLTHTSSAIRHDAELVVAATSHLLECFTSVIVRHNSKNPGRCPNCSSYQLESFYVPEAEEDPPYMLVCLACHWEGPAAKETQ